MNVETIRTSVTSAEFVRHFGMWQDRAATRPIFVTHHGRERLVVLAIANYGQLMQRAAQADLAAITPQSVRLGAVLERLPQGFLAVGADLTVTEMNPAAASYLKVARESALGSSMTDIHPMLGRTLLYSHLMRAIHSGETAAFDQSSFTFEGRWLRCETMPYLDGAALLFRDVTEARQQRQRAEDDAATTVAMTVHSGAGRARLSNRGTFTAIDASFAAMAGFEPEALIRARLTDILPLSRRVDAAHEIESVLAGGPAAAFDSALMVKRGGDLPVRIAIAPLQGEHANEGAIVVVTPM